MIKIFRRIRQQLLTENKFSRYLIYAIGEIVLVVIGILIALQLNTNAQNKILNEKRKEYYNQIIEDFQREIEFFKEFKNGVERDEYAYNQYLKLYENSELKPNEIYNKLHNLRMYSNSFTFNSSTIESLRSSGELILFPLEIRNELLDLVRLQAEVLNQREDNNNGKNLLLMNLGRIRGASTLMGNIESHSNLKEYLNIDRNLPDIILGLDAAHKWKNLSETQTLMDLALIQKDMEEIIEMIRAELKK